MTLWLASISIGLGTISKDNRPEINLLFLSVLIPAIFHYLDARLTRWYNVFTLRDSEIQNFLSNEEYCLPANNKRMSFNQSLKEDNFCFPVYDIDGEVTFGKDKYFNWSKNIGTCLFAQTPFFFFGVQYVVSTIMISLELVRKSYLNIWWLPISVILTILFFIFLMYKRKRKKLSRVRKMLIKQKREVNQSFNSK